MKICFARVRSRVDAIDGMYHLYIELLKEKRRVRELSTLLKTKFKLITMKKSCNILPLFQSHSHVGEIKKSEQLMYQV